MMKETISHRDAGDDDNSNDSIHVEDILYYYLLRLGTYSFSFLDFDCFKIYRNILNIEEYMKSIGTPLPSDFSHLT